MRKERFVITDRIWAIIEPLVPGTASGVGVTAKDTRLFLEAVSGDPDFEYILIDGTIVSVHQKASGAKGGRKIRPLAVQKAG